MREAAYKGLVRPILEYGSSVWDPHYEGLIDDLEKVQKRAARFVTRNYTYEKGSMTGILKKLKWESLQKRRKDNRIILLYKGLKGRAKIPTDDLIPKNRRCRNQHSLAFQIPSASTNAYLQVGYESPCRAELRERPCRARFFTCNRQFNSKYQKRMISYVEIDTTAQVLKILFVMINLKTIFDGIFLFDRVRKLRFSIKSNKLGKLS